MRTSVIAHGNSAPVFEPAEHDLYFVSLLIELFVICNRVFSISFGRNAWSYAFIKQCVAKPSSIVASIRKKCFGIRQGVKQLRSAFVLTHLTCCKEQSNRLAGTVADCVQLRVQSAFCAPDTAGKSPFLSRLAAVRCALRCVASIINRLSAGGVFANSVKI